MKSGAVARRGAEQGPRLRGCDPRWRASADPTTSVLAAIVSEADDAPLVTSSAVTTLRSDELRSDDASLVTSFAVTSFAVMSSAVTSFAVTTLR